MGLTIAEKILLRHTNKREIAPGELIYAKVDFALANDITAPLAIKEFERSGTKKVFDNKKIALVPDHFTPAKDARSAQQCKILREFAKKYNIVNYFEVGQAGIEHVLLPERGLILPGMLVVGADSHTCTYGALGAFGCGVGSTDVAAVMITGKLWFKVPESMKFIYHGRLRRWVSGKDIILHTIGDIGVDGALYKAMEFTGETMGMLGMDDRFTMCNMAVEAGAKTGLIAPDDITARYVRTALKDYTHHGDFSLCHSDPNAKYSEVREYDLKKLQPQVALPHSPANVKPVAEVKKIKIDQVVIGSCTNGRINDLRIAAHVLRNRKAKSTLRLIIIPATQKIYMQALQEGLIEIFVRSGAVVSPPTCGPCLGGHMGILAEGERALATTNRNFMGRMGHSKSEVYLSNPAVAAASAVLGRIGHPEEI
ncbi:MAG: 3-isopropylmalate dehydratase large subunit [Candidatus Omnitrophota bacterium]